jgi:hypothetical protein
MRRDEVDATRSDVRPVSTGIDAAIVKGPFGGKRKIVKGELNLPRGENAGSDGAG